MSVLFEEHNTETLMFLWIHIGLLLAHWVALLMSAAFTSLVCMVRPLWPKQPWPSSLFPSCSAYLFFCIMSSALLQICLFSSCFLLLLRVIPVSWGCSTIHKFLRHCPHPDPLCFWEAVRSEAKGIVSGARSLGFEFYVWILPLPYTNVYDHEKII